MQATDGVAGQVREVVVSPREGRVVALVVELVSGRPVVLPVQLVEDATEQGVRVRGSLRQLEGLPAWEVEAHAPATLFWPGWRALRQGGAWLSLPRSLRRREGPQRQLRDRPQRGRVSPP